MRSILSLSPVLPIVFVAVACGDDTSSGGGPGEGGNGGDPSQGGETTQGGSPSQGGDTAQGGMGGAPVADSEPLGMDCTDECPTFEGRTYVCTFLEGFPTRVGYCSLDCSGEGTLCPDTEPGEVYCNADVGRCVIGCPFDGCPNDMECTFNFNNEPACEPTP